MTVSFVIPHRRRPDLLVSALETLRAQRLPAGSDREVVVVDNASADGSAEVAEAKGARVLRLERNEGVSRALNRGIEAASGDFVVLLNNDVELAEDWTVRLLDALEANGAWFATGKTLDFADRNRIDGAGDAMCRGGAAWRLGHGRIDGPVFGDARTTYFPSATAALFRREFFVRIGGLEESFFAYLEDVDLGLRAGLADLKGVYVPAARAFHRGSQTAGAWSGPTTRWITSHQLLLLAKYYSLGMLLRFAAPIVAAQLLWATLAISRGRGLDWARGAAEGLRRAPALRRDTALLRCDTIRLRAVLDAAEREIADFQRRTGWDTYWKWYFRLAWPPAEKSA